MLISISWERESWACYVQGGDGRRSKVETPPELGAGEYQQLEQWARRQWPQACIQWDEYLM